MSHEQAAVGLISELKFDLDRTTVGILFCIPTSSCPIHYFFAMEPRNSDIFGRVSLDGSMDVSTCQVRPLRIPHKFEEDPRNGEYPDTVQYRNWGYRKDPFNRSEARSESPLRMDTGADGMIPVQEERSRAFDQRDAGTQTVFGGEEKTFWANRKVDLALIPCMFVSCNSDGDICWSRLDRLLSKNADQSLEVRVWYRL